MSPNCPKCNRVLEPATLNKNNRWCAICAVEYTPDGAVVTHEAPPEAPNSGEKKGAVVVPKSAPASVSVKHVEVPVTAATRRFRVAIGSLSFEAQDNVQLDIGDTKVVITAL